MEASKLIPGMQFTSIHFEGTCEIMSVHPERNEIRVQIKKEGSQWVEVWNLMHTEWGFERREYKEITVPRLGGNGVLMKLLNLMDGHGMDE